MSWNSLTLSEVSEQHLHTPSSSKVPVSGTGATSSQQHGCLLQTSSLLNLTFIQSPKSACLHLPSVLYPPPSLCPYNCHLSKAAIISYQCPCQPVWVLVPAPPYFFPTRPKFNSTSLHQGAPHSSRLDDILPLICRGGRWSGGFGERIAATEFNNESNFLSLHNDLI